MTSDKRHADYLLGNTDAEHERLIGLCRPHSLVDKTGADTKPGRRSFEDTASRKRKIQLRTTTMR